MHHLQTNEKLAQMFKNGDSNALGLIYLKVRVQLTNYLFRILNDKEAAEDVVGNVFADFVKKGIPTYKTQKSFLTWMYQVGRNKAIDFMRSNGRYAKKINALCLDPTFAPNLEGGVPSDTFTFVMGVVNEVLTCEKQKKAFMLYYIEGLTHDQIATELHRPLGTVKSQIKRGLVKVQKEIEKFPNTFA